MKLDHVRPSSSAYFFAVCNSFSVREKAVIVFPGERFFMFLGDNSVILLSVMVWVFFIVGWFWVSATWDQKGG